MKVKVEMGQAAPSPPDGGMGRTKLPSTVREQRHWPEGSL